MTSKLRSYLRSGRSMRLLAAGVVVAASGVWGISAWAQHMPSGPPGLMGLPLHGHMLDRMLDSAGANAEQRTQIRKIAEDAATDLKAQADAGRSLREQGLQLFAQPSVDANQAEAIRQQMLARHDQASRRVLQAMLDISRVLTPEQRRHVADSVSAHAEMRQRHQRERAALDGTGARP